MRREKGNGGKAENARSMLRSSPVYVNIEAVLNHSGLARDACLLADVLTAAGWSVTINTRHRSTLARGVHALAKSVRRYPYGLNIFLEQVDPRRFGLAPVHVLIPNQEWLRPETIPHLPRIDLVLCKTRHAERIFRDKGFPTAYVGFTSHDRFDSRASRDYGAFLHVAGVSQQRAPTP